MSEIGYKGDALLDIMSENAVNRNRYIEKLIVSHLAFDDSDKSLRVLEYGAGKGEFLSRFKDRKNLSLSAIDSDPDYRTKLSEISEVFKSIEAVPSGLDTIYLIDVLEHIEDDKLMLMKFHDKLKKGGKLFIYVPARMELYSSFDKKIGHYRRYSRRELKEKVMNAGFTVQVIRYHELTGYFALLFRKLFSNKEDLSASHVRLYDKFFVPVTNFIERFIPLPIGKSIYLLAVKND